MTIFTVRRVRWAAVASVSAALAACASSPDPDFPQEFPTETPAPSTDPQPDSPPATAKYKTSGNKTIDKWRVQFAKKAANQGRQDWAVRAVLEGVEPLDAYFGKTFETATKSDPASQAEFAKPIWEYLRTAVANSRRVKGAREVTEREAMFNAMEAKYGVNGEVLAAIWGMETIFGGNIGSDDAAHALANMAAEGRRRSFAENELMALIKILERGEATRDQFISSWAGAMGQTQFMPTTYVAYAEDWEGDGKKNIWDSEADALASAANYLAKSGYKLNQPWGIEVSVPDGFDYSVADGVERPMTAWNLMGLQPIAGGPFVTNGASDASLWLPAGATGPKYLLFDNFKAFRTYNRANSYALAVGLLSDAIDGGSGDPQTPWPTDLQPLTKGQLMTLQASLNQLGYDAGPVDGIIGSRTRGALQQFQKARGFVADGYPTLEMLAYVQNALNPQASSYIPNSG